MIRINLLGRPRPKVKRRVAIPGGLQVILFAIPVGLAIIALIVHYSLIQREIERLRQDIQQKQSEKRTLAQLEQEINEYEEEQRRLQARLDVIETLKRNQVGPRRLLEAVGDTVSLTETVWLTEMEDRGGNEIQFRGRAGSMNAVANFITNLNQSGVFQDVEIEESVERPGEDGAASFEFTLSAKFVLPAPPAGQTQTPQPSAAAGGGR